MKQIKTNKEMAGFAYFLELMAITTILVAAWSGVGDYVMTVPYPARPASLTPGDGTVICQNAQECDELLSNLVE